MAPGYDIFKKPDQPAKGEPPKGTPPESYAFFGPPDTTQRFRFGVLKEEGDLISLQPGAAKFKKGLTARRWAAAEGGEPTVYGVVKTTPSRIDLKKITKKA